MKNIITFQPFFDTSSHLAFTKTNAECWKSLSRDIFTTSHKSHDNINWTKLNHATKSLLIDSVTRHKLSKIALFLKIYGWLRNDDSTIIFYGNKSFGLIVRFHSLIKTRSKLNIGPNKLRSADSNLKFSSSLLTCSRIHLNVLCSYDVDFDPRCDFDFILRSKIMHYIDRLFERLKSRWDGFVWTTVTWLVPARVQFYSGSSMTWIQWEEGLYSDEIQFLPRVLGKICSLPRPEIIFSNLR